MSTVALGRLWNSLTIECFLFMYDLSGFEVYLHCKTITSQNVSPKVQIKNSYSIEKLCSILKKFKFSYF